MEERSEQETVSGSEQLMRRICPDPRAGHIKIDESTGEVRLASGAFSASSRDGGISVEREELLLANGLSIDDRIDHESGEGAARLVAGAVRNIELDVVPDPIPDNEPDGPNPFHAQIVGNITPGKRKKLRDVAVLVIEPYQLNL